MGDRYVLLGVAPARADWFRRVAAWSASAALPAEFVRCVSLEEAVARLSGERTFSAALIDAGTAGLDRDAVATAARAGCAVIVVDGPVPRRDWRQLGAAAVLTPDLSQRELMEALAAVTVRVPTARFDAPVPAEPVTTRRGRLLAVTGPGGTGASVVAIALAEGVARAPGLLPALVDEDHVYREVSQAPTTVVLADLARVADHALYHDAHELVPGLQELVEGHRTGRPTDDEVLAQTFDVPERGYRLLLGLRRPHHWVGLRRHAVEAALGSLCAVADVVVADVDADVEGEQETGSHDVEERNLLARTTLPRADLVLVVGDPSLRGLAGLVRVVGSSVAAGVDPERVLPVINRSPRSPRRRAELTRALTELVVGATGVGGERITPPLHVPDRDPEPALRDGSRLPVALSRPLARGVAAIVGRRDRVADGRDPEPVRIVPGTVATFTSQEPPSS